MLLAVVGFTTTALAQEDEWTTVFENSLGGEWNTVPSDPIYTNGFVRSNSPNLSLLDPSSSYFPSSTFTTDPNVYLAVKKNLEPGTYKFSFRVKGGINKKINVFYTTDISNTLNRNILLENLNTSSTEANWGPKETGEFEISVAGEYYIGICGATDDSFKYLFLADFIIYKKGGAEPAPTTFTVNFSNIENGTIEVTANGETINSGDAVEDGTEITITPTANPGYKVKTVYANGTKLTPKPETVDGQMILRYKTTVTENTEITIEFVPVEYSISVSAATNGSIVVYNTTDLENPLENNTKLTAGNQVKVVATPNPDYKLARVYYKYTGYGYESEAIEITDNGEGYIFTIGPDPESANTAIYIYAEFVEDAPVETWSEVHFNSLSGSSSNEINLNNDPYYIYPAQTGTDNWNTTNSSGASETANKFGPYIKDVAEGYYLAYRHEVEQKATYRFSFLHKKAETVETTAKLCYTTDLSGAFTDASDIVALEKKKGNETGVLFQSNNIDLEKGSYYFIYYIVSGGTSKVRIADFKLEMLDGSAVEPTMPSITVKRPANGSLFIEYTVNEETKEIDTETFENDSEIFNIPENTVMNIYPTAEFDYELEKILPEGMEEKTDMRGRKYYVLTVTKDVTIEATFKAIQYGKVSVTKPEETQGSIEIQLHDPMYDKWVPADNFFLEAVEFGTELRAKVETKTGYTIKSVMKNGSAIDKNTDEYYYFTVDAEEITISATFEAKTFTLTKEVTPEEGGSVSVKLENNEEAGETLKYREIITITATPNEGYLSESIEISGADEIDGQSGKYQVRGDVTVTAIFKKNPSSINNAENTTVYYNAKEEVLHIDAAKSVRVYDLSGRLVINADNQENISLAELAEGVYTAVIDGKAVKFNK